MPHRFLLCIVLFSLVAGAQPNERATDGNTETWAFGYESEEGGSGSSYMGVDIADVTSERLSALKLKEEHGAEITMVDADAPAGKAGLREHDVILSVNGTTIESAAQLRRMIKETPPGRVVALGISRDGQPQTIKVQLADRNKSKSWQPGNHEFNFKMPELPALPDFDMPVTVVIAHSSVRSGLMVENITPQLGEFFGAKDGKGALVRSVEKGSRGEKAGFRAGDVVVKVNGQPVHSATDFTASLRKSSAGSVTVIILRDKHEQTLTLTLPDKKDSGFLQENTLDLPNLGEEAKRALAVYDTALAQLDPEELQRELSKASEAWKCAQQQILEKQQEMQQQQEEMRQEQQERLQEQQQEMQQQVQEQQEESQQQQQEMQQQQEEMRQEQQNRLQEQQQLRRDQQRQVLDPARMRRRFTRAWAEI